MLNIKILIPVCLTEAYLEIVLPKFDTYIIILFKKHRIKNTINAKYVQLFILATYSLILWNR